MVGCLNYIIRESEYIITETLSLVSTQSQSTPTVFGSSRLVSGGWVRVLEYHELFVRLNRRSSIVIDSES
jgi:hypothetical protein